jgi:putative cell wall-binding protein
MRARTTFLVAIAFGLVASTLTIVVGAEPARADENDVYDITFPVIGPVYFGDTFYSCRSGCSRRHYATDIMTYGKKGLPVVAAHDGVIVAMATGSQCCAIWGLRHDDGWETVYIHMNNDTPYTDDGIGGTIGFAPGIEVGVRVERGQLLGWVGDSGNAENVAAHLHFEIHDPSCSDCPAGFFFGNPPMVNPYNSLLAADRSLMPRIAGADRYDTAVEISKTAFPGGASVAYIATGTEFADALAGGPAAANAGGPVLLTKPDSLPPVTRDELERLNPDRIVILGGVGAVAANVENALGDYAPDVDRMAGANRYATAAAVSAAHYDPGVNKVYIANGEGFADALAGAPAAAVDGAPLLLALRDSIPQPTIDELTRLGPNEIVILGGTGVISDAVASQLEAYAGSGNAVRLAGANRYETAAAISAYAFPDAPGAYVATGLGFADALAGVPLAAQAPAPILLVEDPVDASVEDELNRLGLSEVTILGGLGAVPGNAEVELWMVFNGGTYPIWDFT